MPDSTTLPVPLGVRFILPLLLVLLIVFPSTVILSTFKTFSLLLASTMSALLAVTVPGVTPFRYVVVKFKCAAVAVTPSRMFNSAVLEVIPSRVFSSAVLAVKPSNRLISAVLAVTPSRMFNSATLAVKPDKSGLI